MHLFCLSGGVCHQPPWQVQSKGTETRAHAGRRAWCTSHEHVPRHVYRYSCIWQHNILQISQGLFIYIFLSITRSSWWKDPIPIWSCADNFWSKSVILSNIRAQSLVRVTNTSVEDILRPRGDTCWVCKAQLARVRFASHRLCADNFCSKSMTLSYDGSSEPGWGQEHRVQSCSEAIGRRWLSVKGAADPCVHSMPHSKYMYAVRCPRPSSRDSSQYDPQKKGGDKKGAKSPDCWKWKAIRVGQNFL